MNTISKMEIAITHNNYLRKLAAFRDEPDIMPVNFSGIANEGNSLTSSEWSIILGFFSLTRIIL